MFDGFCRDFLLAAVNPRGEAWRREASEAVRAEVRKNGTVAQFIAERFEPLGAEDEGLYRIWVRGRAEFDWTWEGSVAYQLRDPDDPTDRVWSGEVVQVDADRGQIYVSMRSGTLVEGPLCVRPFDFLDALQTLFLQCETVQETARGVEAALVATLGSPPRRKARVDPGTSSSSRGDGPLPTRGFARPWGILWGPPGTGKTWTIGRQVARVLSSGAADERLLVVSTTNRATDAVALQIADALCDRGLALDAVRRLGTGSDLAAYEARRAEQLIARTEAEGRRLLGRLLEQRRRTDDPELRARLSVQINATRRSIRDAAGAFLDPDHRVVVCTAYQASSQAVTPEIAQLRAAGRAPFTTVVIDEAGLVGRAMSAMLAQLAARRVWLVGDPRQLAPISRVARVLPSARSRWLASSALSHLDPAAPVPDNVDVLTVQHRMGPEIRRVVSTYAYDGRLNDAPSVLDRTFAADGLLLSQPRAFWYVLDEDTGGRLADIRAERGPGHRSWIRRRTVPVLDTLLRAHPSLAGHRTLIMTPFRAQASALTKWIACQGLGRWEACTVHAQQGAEAPVVFFDPVHAGSTAWPADEWRRLVNVAISRAQHQLVILASRLEMQEPYLRPLARTLATRVLEREGDGFVYRQVPGIPREASAVSVQTDDPTLGAQFAARRSLLPVLSREQERLCASRLDGGPRLVRGVAGSGKTWVLAYWLARTLRDASLQGRAVVVYANRSLRGLLDGLARRAWAEVGTGRSFPQDRVSIVHVRDLLDQLLEEEGLPPVEGYDFDEAVRRYQTAVPDWAHRPRFAVLFVDEAQDLGPETLRLLAALVRPHSARSSLRPIHIFYDNAQNLYGRGTPRWSELGIAVRGRSTVLGTSHRGTRPIAEFALNVLDRLVDLDRDPDHRELVKRGLVQVVDEGSRRRLAVGFNQVDGPSPSFAGFDDRSAELDALAHQISIWVGTEGVRPGDIRVLANSPEVRDTALALLMKRLRPLGVIVEQQARQTLSTDPGTLVITTAHSFKGHEAEIVCVPGVERFVARSADPPEILARALYVALTRARSVLYVSGTSPTDPTSPAGWASQTVLSALAETLADLGGCPGAVATFSQQSSRSFGSSV